MMQSQTNQTYNSTVSIIDENFTNNRNNWEEVDNNKECARIENGNYYMENHDEWSWKFYHLNFPIKRNDNFKITTRISIEKIVEIGQAGIVWGFDKNHEVLNRFTIAADLKRFTIMQFEKDHRKIYHRFSDKLNRPLIKSINELMIIKENKYLFFKINDSVIYICHEAHFCNYGPRVGYYVEPGIKISSNFFSIELLKY